MHYLSNQLNEFSLMSFLVASGGALLGIGIDWLRAAEFGETTIITITFCALSCFVVYSVVYGVRYVGRILLNPKTGQLPTITNAINELTEATKVSGGHSDKITEMLVEHHTSTKEHAQACVETGESVFRLRQALILACSKGINELERGQLDPNRIRSVLEQIERELRGPSY